MPDLSLNYKKRLRELKTPYGAVLFCPGSPGSGSILYDKSLYANNGVITGATWERSPSGLWGNSFDGDDSISFGNSDNLKTLNSMSCLVWTKTLGTNSVMVIIGHYDSGANKRKWMIYNGGNTPPQSTYLVVALSDDGTSNAGTFKRYLTNFAVYDGSWKLVGFTFDAPTSTLSLYVNGVLVTDLTKATNGAITSLYQSPTTNVTMGANYNSGVLASFQTGINKLLLITPTVLTAGWISNWYQQTRKFFNV